MHAVKGSWVGQTFALARGNESEGRKSRIRRSKEERKAMVESFIQKHQKLNNGSFPSLNLTHKEVGGSFYTVREIVRDIIQENRVLGPAKFAEEDEINQHLDNEPLGSIALADQYPLTISSNGLESVETEFQSGYKELSSTFDRHQSTPEEHQLLDNGKFINGTPVDRKAEGLGVQNDEQTQGLEVVEAGQNDNDGPEKENNVAASDGDYGFIESDLVSNGSLVDAMIKESHDITQTELQVDTVSEVENVEVELVASEVKATVAVGDFEVETFPMRPADTESEGLSSELKDKEHNFSENDTEKKELAVVGSCTTDEVDASPSFVVVDIKEDNEALKESSSDLISTSTTVISEQSDAIAGAKVIGASNGMKMKYADCNGGTNGMLKAEKEVGLQQNGRPQKESNPTLDRINLESWDGASEKPRRSQDNNPLWSVFKAFVDAFVKFWSE